MVRFVPPELVSVSVWVCVFPIREFPKLMLAGFPARLPAETAVPEIAMLEGFPPPSVSTRFPLAAPAL